MFLRTSSKWNLSHRIFYYLVDHQAIVPIDISGSDTDPYSWKKTQALADSCWSRFIREFMPCLQTRSRRTKHYDELEPGDLFFFFEDYTVRGKWPVGKVKLATKGTDNVARSCELVTSFGTIKRPVENFQYSSLIITTRNFPNTDVHYQTFFTKLFLFASCK